MTTVNISYFVPNFIANKKVSYFLYKQIIGATDVGAQNDAKGLNSALTSGIKISEVVIKKVYDSDDKKIVFIVTLVKGRDRVTNNVKDVTVTFA